MIGSIPEAGSARVSPAPSRRDWICAAGMALQIAAPSFYIRLPHGPIEPNQSGAPSSWPTAPQTAPKLWKRMRKMNDHRQYAPATLRNRDFILGILRDVLPTRGVILEIASGSGEHVVHFARNFPSLVFQPSDREPGALQSVAAWVKATRVTNVRAPMVLDASQSPWPIASA